jgi:hypothetical protein
MGPFIHIDKLATDSVKGYSQGWRPSRGSYYNRGRGGRGSSVHRNRTLVLNNNSTTSSQPDSDIDTIPAGTEHPSGNSASGWVTKTDRHLQLINTTIFEKETLNRAKAIEETRKQKLRQRDEREKAKLMKHLQILGGEHANFARPSSTNTASNYEIEVQGIRFRVTNNGSKLAKVPGEISHTLRALNYRFLQYSPYPGDLNAAKATPKTALVGGVRFYRTKNGNMYRSGIIKAQR